MGWFFFSLVTLINPRSDFSSLSIFIGVKLATKDLTLGIYKPRIKLKWACNFNVCLRPALVKKWKLSSSDHLRNGNFLVSTMLEFHHSLFWLEIYARIYEAEKLLHYSSQSLLRFAWQSFKMGEKVKIHQFFPVM